MREINVLDACEGMTLAKPVMNINGSLILDSGVRLKKNMLNILKKLNIQSIHIETDETAAILKSAQSLGRPAAPPDADSAGSIPEIYFSQESDMKEVIDETRYSREEIRQALRNIEEDHSEAISLEAVKGILNKIIYFLTRHKEKIVLSTYLTSRFDYLVPHSINVAIYSMLLGMAMNLPAKQLIDLGLAALYHDIGMLKIDSRIFNKRTRLSDVEKNVIRSHPELSYNIALNLEGITIDIAILCLQHHERFSGGGYPKNLTSEEMTLTSQILQTADVYDALISPRPDRDRYHQRAAMEYIAANRVRLFNPHIVNVLINELGPYPIGSLVELSNSRKAIVYKNNPRNINYPMVKAFTPEEHEKLAGIAKIRGDPGRKEAGFPCVGQGVAELGEVFYCSPTFCIKRLVPAAELPLTPMDILLLME